MTSATIAAARISVPTPNKMDRAVGLRLPRPITSITALRSLAPSVRRSGFEPTLAKCCGLPLRGRSFARPTGAAYNELHARNLFLPT